MKYLLNKDKENSNRVKNIVITIVIIATLFIWRNSVSVFLFNNILIVSQPLWNLENYISDEIASFLINFQDKESLLSDKEILNKQLGLLTVYNLENKILREENIELKKLLTPINFDIKETNQITEKNKNIKEKEKKTTEIKNINVALAYVIAGPMTPPYDVLLVNAGKNNKVEVGDLAIDTMGGMVGEVLEVYSTASKIRLFSSYGVKTPVFLGNNKTMIEIDGSGSGNFFVSLPSEFTVDNNDRAIFTGSEIKTVAIVGEIEKKNGDAFKRVYLKTPFNVKEIRYVEIIKNNNLQI